MAQCTRVCSNNKAYAWGFAKVDEMRSFIVSVAFAAVFGSGIGNVHGQQQPAAVPVPPTPQVRMGPPLEVNVHSLGENRTTNLVVIYHRDGTFDLTSGWAGAMSGSDYPNAKMFIPGETTRGFYRNRGNWWWGVDNKFCFRMAEGQNAGKDVCKSGRLIGRVSLDGTPLPADAPPTIIDARRTLNGQVPSYSGTNVCATGGPTGPTRSPFRLTRSPLPPCLRPRLTRSNRRGTCPVCPVVWEGRHREVSPYPDHYLFYDLIDLFVLIYSIELCIHRYSPTYSGVHCRSLN